jgi:cytochrome c biogenesis protein CcdA
MVHLVVLVLLVGGVDSLNPSTIAPALYLAAGSRPRRRLGELIIGIFVVNLVGGLVIALGPGQALLDLAPHPGEHLRHLIELGLGAAILVLAGGLWHERRRIARRVSEKPDRLDRSSLLLGAGISAVELPTALPYFAVIAAVVESGHAIPLQVVLLALFNLVFVLPLLGILAVRGLAGSRGRLALERLRAGLDSRLAVLVPSLVLVAAVVLLALGGIGLLSE